MYYIGKINTGVPPGLGGTSDFGGLGGVGRLDKPLVWTKLRNCWGHFEKILKCFNENSMKIMNFKQCLKIFSIQLEPSGITSFFYNNFPLGEFPMFPLAAPVQL